ncbi:imidazolonepropionase [Gilvibacter sediminis]|uniref:imidazolonepropionase n=1 Tax=Gilvibacter sediminis TaxID=379071 RepID=UPI00234FF21F|nr:imidazolonepropionase [Gilvibacter sediminis]MDC7997971.1 imidazolonepropionase [Gilvibacter sediminis]
MILIKNIKALVQVRDQGVRYLSGAQMQELPQLENAWLTIENRKISGFGTMDSCPTDGFTEVKDVKGSYVLPTWCDSHTHLVYAGNREKEFDMRLKGASYQEIAEAGGGILNSAKAMGASDITEVYAQAVKRMNAVIKMGTGAIEIKSGYGLTMETERMMLKIAKRFAYDYDIPVRTSFLAAHAVPSGFENSAAYIDHIISDMLPAIAESGLADYIDIFCEDGYFSLEDTDRLLAAGAQYSLRPKIHVNQFTANGGVAMGVKHNALSVDHLEELTEEDIQALKGSETMPVALPGCSLFLGIPYTPARRIIDAGLPLALATDYNPGSAPSGNMNLVVALACSKMKMTPEEAINAATINGAYAMGLETEVGSITVGKRANLIITEPIPSIGYLPYSFGQNHIQEVLISGYSYKPTN